MSNQCDRVDATFEGAGLADGTGERVIVAYRVTVPSYALDRARKAAYRYAERLSADYGSYCATVNPVWGAK